MTKLVSEKYTRYFAFGCSYVNYKWLTVADLIGANFPNQFYNMGRPGGCNEFSCSMLFRANEIYKFNPDTDFITFGVTGIGRKTFVRSQKLSSLQQTMVFEAHGDIFPGHDQHPDFCKLWSKFLDNNIYALYRTVESLRKVKFLLDVLGMDYVIYPSVDYENYDFPESGMINYLVQFMDITESIDYFWSTTDLKLGIDYNDMFKDTHHTSQVHYEYLKKYFKSWDTAHTKTLLADFGNVDLRSETHQKERFLNYYKEYNIQHINENLRSVLM